MQIASHGYLAPELGHTEISKETEKMNVKYAKGYGDANFLAADCWTAGRVLNELLVVANLSSANKDKTNKLIVNLLYGGRFQRAGLDIPLRSAITVAEQRLWEKEREYAS